jgi:cellulose synthase/poly-beta-1,6-N-acetylglucosamine synthase-like glycosyltransferase
VGRATATPRGTAAPWLLPGVAGLVGAAVLVGAGPLVVDGLATVTGLVFLAYAARHTAFAVAAVRGAPVDLAQPVLDAASPPSVTVVAACRDEIGVVDDLITACDRLEHPAGLLRTVVVDDGSVDGTGERLDQLAATRPSLTVVHRTGGAGGKAGALNAALPSVTGEVVVVFDADHRPAPDTVTRLVRHLADPGVAVAQGRCRIGNADASVIARVVAVDYLAGYLVNEYGRQALAGLPACGGSNYAIRADDLRRVGGWNPGSVTEDTDLTLRLLLAGRRIRYDVTAVDTEEAVTTLPRFWTQRYRWARGHQQVCRDHRRAVLRAPHLSTLERLEALAFLFSYHVPVLSVLGFGLLALWATGTVTPAPALAVPVLWTLLFLGPLVELGAGLAVAGSARRAVVTVLAFVPLYLVSALVSTKAWVDGVCGRPYTWVKTGRAADPVVTP